MSPLSISNYQLGDMIGRGASGTVYRALNFLTGETVAIKSISLLTLSPSVLPDIMSEIDLLKNLNHPNIVKYKGFVRDKESLHIILEYCENGSLQTILKKFGKFPESLVAVYIAQVLEGLIYLHEQGVIHRDIKGANILTDKSGSVKLADFGVSSRTAGPQINKEGEDGEVVGSPYWMAPEVIEQSGSSTASDIWSVGCVVVELLDGQPPYSELAPMQALWRIVQDESMRIPPGASPIVKDFLGSCFQKDPNLRVSAKKLLRHPWMASARRSVQDSESPPAPPPRVPTSSKLPVVPEATNDSPRKQAQPGPVVKSSSGSNMATIRAAKPTTVYDEAVMRVREWNEALNASPTKMGSVRRLPQIGGAPRKTSNAALLHKKKPSDHNPLAGLFSKPSPPSREPAQSGAEEPSTNPDATSHNVTGQKAPHVSQVLNRAKEEEPQGESWDDDFASDITFANLPRKDAKPAQSGKGLMLGGKKGDVSSEEDNQHTLRPGRSLTPGLAFSGKDKNPAGSRAVSTSVIEDYSDIAFDEDEGGLAAKLAHLKLRNKTQRGILHPNDLRKLPRPPTSPAQRATSTPDLPPALTQIPTPTTPLLPSPSALSVTSPRPVFRSPPSSRQNSYRSRTESAEPHPELEKYTENDDEDYSDIFDKNTAIGSTSTRSLQLTKRGNRSWSGLDDADEPDPFADMEDDFSAEDLDANVLRDKKATLCANIDKLIDGLVPKTSMSELRQTSDELLALLENAHEDLGLESHFTASHGMLAILEILEEKLSRDVAVRLLKIVNIVVMSDMDALEAFCLVGGILVIIPYTTNKHSLETRLEAASFVQQLTRSDITLQMFISCRGLKVLVELLDEDYTVNRTLILSALEGIESVFDLQSPTPRNDFCRMFVREDILDPLSNSILSIMRDKSLSAEDDSCSRAVNLLLLFSQVSQADNRVREAFANRSIMIRLLDVCSGLPKSLLLVAIKAIKHLATSPQLIETLQNSMAMNVLVSLLDRTIKKSHGNEIGAHIFQTIYSMTRLSKARQEEAASSGIVPLLKTVIERKSPLKPFALPVLCDLANAGKVSRRQLWKVDGLKLYLSLLDDRYWSVPALDAILAWMQDETARVEDVLLEKEASEAIMNCFIESTGLSLEGILDPILKMLRLSVSLTTTISQPPLFKHLAATLVRPLKAVTKLNLLRLTRVIFESHADVSSLAKYGVREAVDRLSRQDDAVLVRELAKEILPTLGPKPAPPTPVRPSSNISISDSVSSSGRYKDPSLRSSSSRPSPIPTSRGMPPPPVPDRSASSSYSHSHSRSASSHSQSTQSQSHAQSQNQGTSSSNSNSTRRANPPPSSPRSTTSSSSHRQLARDSSNIGTGTSMSTGTDHTHHYSHGAHVPSLLGRTHDVGEPVKHKRRISRQLSNVEWQNDENGQLRTVRKVSK